MLHSLRRDRIDPPRGWTPLNIAAEKGHWEVVLPLIEARANVEAKDHAGRGAWERRSAVSKKGCKAAQMHQVAKHEPGHASSGRNVFKLLRATALARKGLQTPPTN